MAIQAARVQSPSSINTYKHCPRKYFYTYIARIPTKTNIHCVRGTIVHSVLEHFYDLGPIPSLPLGDSLIIGANSLLEKYWDDSKKELDGLNMPKAELQTFFDSSKEMLNKWVISFLGKLAKFSNEQNVGLAEGFSLMKPESEGKYISKEFSVMGYIDAIETHGGKIRVMDYKTSKKDELTEEYKLQLAIYALLYQENTGKLPDEVGLYLLKHGERTLAATPDLVKHAQFEVENIHLSTQSKDMGDYNKHITPLCKWRTGQCDFYDVCFAKTLNDF